ncbi:hypothetical protein QYE76_069971 [Lolium multiflorum]|uniref:Uncharacterized protein n=1 Tax=Lolium multiflorum TaxID=4521 RepID=A0AAD8SIS7_LOLMU|nr:hypothetical protein QYE76_069971 [Lolium multiflorum]
MQLSAPQAGVVTEKLGGDNFPLWKAQVMPPLRERQLVGFLDGRAKKPPQTIDVEVDLEKGGTETRVVPNPAYAAWVAQDQQVLGFLLSSLTRGVMQIRMQLASAQKGEKRVSEYFARMRSLGDAMVSAGKKMDEDDLTAYILAGLDADWNPLVTSMTTRADPVPLSELYAHLLNFETRLDIQNGGAQGSGGPLSFGGLQGGGGGTSSVNLASRGGGRSGYRGGGRGGGRGRGDGGRGNGNGGGNFTNNSGRPNSQQPFDANGNPRPQCQVCAKYGHTAIKCWKRFNKEYTGEEKPAGSSSAYGVDTNWYLDTGATDHVTGELEKLTVRDSVSGTQGGVHGAGVSDADSDADSPGGSTSPTQSSSGSPSPGSGGTADDAVSAPSSPLGHASGADAPDSPQHTHGSASGQAMGSSAATSSASSQPHGSAAHTGSAASSRETEQPSAGRSFALEPPRSSVAGRPVTRLQNKIQKPVKLFEGMIRYANFAATGEPENVQEAFGDSKWKSAMEEEYMALQRNKTWHLVPAKQGRNIIDCKWVYKIKRKSDGTIERVLNPAYRTTPHTHTSYRRSYSRKRDQEAQPKRLRGLEEELESTVSGWSSPESEPFSRAPQQHSFVAEAPPEADHHQGPTRVAHRPRSSTKEARPGKGTEQALPMIAEEPPPSQPSESLVLWTPRRCLQEENDTGVPPPPDPRI